MLLLGFGMKKILYVIALVMLLTLTGCGRSEKAKEHRTKKLTGYCYAQERYLSDQELTNLAVGRLLENLQTRYETLSKTDKENTINYTSLEQFFQINSQCCPVISKPGDLEFAEARIARLKNMVYMTKLAIVSFQIFSIS